VLPADLRPLAEALSRWAARGGLDTLGRILYGTHGDQRDRCFAPSFLRWLAKLDSAINLPDLDAVSFPDFEDMAALSLDRLSDPLHVFFARRGEMHVLWRLASVVGLVAKQRRGNSSCPPLWKDRYPVLHRLFAQMEQVAAHQEIGASTAGTRHSDAFPERFLLDSGEQVGSAESSRIRSQR
jgi:hypothetical protein